MKSFKSTVKRTTFEKLDFSRFPKGQKFQKKHVLKNEFFFQKNCYHENAFSQNWKVLENGLWNFVLRDIKFEKLQKYCKTYYIWETWFFQISERQEISEKVRFWKVFYSKIFAIMSSGGPVPAGQCRRVSAGFVSAGGWVPACQNTVKRTTSEKVKFCRMMFFCNLECASLFQKTEKYWKKSMKFHTARPFFGKASKVL